MEGLNTKTILLMDDDVHIRLVLKKILARTLINTKIYVSEKGPEGLGLAYIIKPNLIILDTTLPQYSGREIIDFIITNQSFVNTKVIVLHEDNDISHLLNLGYYILTKNDPDFTTKLIGIVKSTIESHPEDVIYRLSVSFGRNIIRFSNYSNNNILTFAKEGDIFIKTYNVLAFFVNQIATSVFLTLFLILLGRKDPEEELVKNKDEYNVYRGQSFPTFILASIAVLLTIFLILFIILT